MSLLTTVKRRIALPLSLSSIAALTIAVLAIAAPAQAQSPTSSTRLQTLVNDSVAQLQLSYRHDLAERQKRYEAVGQAIAAWNKSARGPAENERLAEWLRAAIRASMPGSHDPLPLLPEFEPPTPPRTAEPAARESSHATEPSPSESTQAASNDHGAAIENASAETKTNAEATTHAATAEQPGGRDENDPFRDDPLPSDK